MMNRHLLAAGAAFAFSAGAAATVQADEMKYIYTGNTFDDGNGLLTNPCTPGDAGCRIKSITVEFIHEKLSSDLSYPNPLTPSAWSISDGLTTVTDTSGWMIVFNFFSIGTGANGVPDKWSFNVFVDGLAVGDPTELRTRNSGSSLGEFTQYCQTVTTTGCFSQGKATAATFGSWTVAKVIEIDISPWTKRNWIIPWSRGYVAVAVHSTDDFDAEKIDERTVRFGPAEARVAAS